MRRVIGQEDIVRAEETIRNVLDGKRLRHCLGTREYALQLAAIHDCDPLGVELISLLHDWAKEAPREEFARLVQEGKIQADPQTLEMPKLYHGYLSALWIQQEFSITDSGLLDAVRYHPTGDASLNKAGRILFVADYAEPYREHRDAEDVREIAENSLHGAVGEVLKQKLNYLIERKRAIHWRSIEFWNRWLREAQD